MTYKKVIEWRKSTEQERKNGCPEMIKQSEYFVIKKAHSFIKVEKLSKVQKIMYNIILLLKKMRLIKK